MEAVRKMEVNEIPITKEMKARQAELAAIYKDALVKLWGEDDSTMKWCVKNVYWYVELPNGMFIPISKQNIETRFCFGYSDWYPQFGYDDACKEADNARKSEAHFIHENMKHYEDILDHLIGDTRFTNVPYLRVKYWRLPDDSNIRELCWSSQCYDGDVYWYKQGQIVENEGHKDYVPTNEELNLIIDGVKIAMQMHRKRINTYLKKYGLTKVHAWTYWMDE
jgi:hypothetical protein